MPVRSGQAWCAWPPPSASPGGRAADCGAGFRANSATRSHGCRPRRTGSARRSRRAAGSLHPLSACSSRRFATVRLRSRAAELGCARSWFCHLCPIRGRGRAYGGVGIGRRARSGESISRSGTLKADVLEEGDVAPFARLWRSSKGAAFRKCPWHSPLGQPNGVQ